MVAKLKSPLPDEVREIVERLRAYPTRDGLLAADMIERLARQVPVETDPYTFENGTPFKPK